MDWVAWVRRQGVVLESARGPLPSLAERVAGEPIRGSWWSHPASHEIWAAIQTVRGSPAVVATRLVDGKVTLIHRRLWPALVRLEDRFPPAGLRALHEEHTASGSHRTFDVAFDDWVPDSARATAKGLSVEAALAELPAGARPASDAVHGLPRRSRGSR